MNAVKFKLLTRDFADVKRRAPFVKLGQAG
jgi:hypothetical protein